MLCCYALHSTSGSSSKKKEYCKRILYEASSLVPSAFYFYFKPHPQTIQQCTNSGDRSLRLSKRYGVHYFAWQLFFFHFCLGINKISQKSNSQVYQRRSEKITARNHEYIIQQFTGFTAIRPLSTFIGLRTVLGFTITSYPNPPPECFQFSFRSLPCRGAVQGPGDCRPCIYWGPI